MRLPLDPVDLYADPEEVGTMSADALQWLLDQGVTVAAVATPWAVRAAHVSFEPMGVYRPNPCGEFAYILGCIDSDGVADLVAWSPRVGRLASRLGIARLLGQRQAEDARCDISARPVRVWRNPLGWLMARRSGVVIVDQLGAAHLLAGIDIRPEDARHARELRDSLRVPPPRILLAARSDIGIPISTGRRAAA